MKHLRSRTYLFALSFVVSAGLCPVAMAGKGTPDDPWVIGMSQCNLGEPWRVQMNADIKKAADAHPELRVIYKDAQNDTLKQIAHVREFISQKVDALIISPKEAVPLTEPVAEAFQNGIPVIVLDRAVVGDRYTQFIGADNVRIGYAAGRWLVEKLKGKGKVVELKGLMTSVPGQDRHKGFRQAIAGTDIEVIFEADMQWLEPNARKEMESALARFPQIDAVYAHNDPGAHGAYLAAKAVGREKNIIFVGIDALPHEGQAYVAQGILNATFEYPTGGKEAIESVLRILHGETVPKKIVLPSRYFTRDNLAQGGEWLPEPQSSESGEAAAPAPAVSN
jgi:ribose transport system substrate-binding protein